MKIIRIIEMYHHHQSCRQGVTPRRLFRGLCFASCGQFSEFFALYTIFFVRTIYTFRTKLTHVSKYFRALEDDLQRGHSGSAIVRSTRPQLKSDTGKRLNSKNTSLSPECDEFGGKFKICQKFLQIPYHMVYRIWLNHLDARIGRNEHDYQT